MIRLFDIVISILVIIILFVIFLFISLAIVLDSKGGVFYTQLRVGLHGKLFKIYKFRTMFPNSKRNEVFVLENKKAKITRIGYYLRKYKIDEFPQFLNVIFGQMSIVGPRPEVKSYVDLYTLDQSQVLNVKPGITDYASIKYRNESEILSLQDDPKKYYIEVILPDKLILNRLIINDLSVKTYFTVIYLTIINLIFRVNQDK